MHSHTTELLPCPFCGDAADCAKTLNFPPDDWQWYVRCYCDVAPASWNESREKAIAAWNRRSYATALCQQAELLRQAREFIDTVHDGEYGYSECTRDELVEKIDTALSTSKGKTE